MIPNAATANGAAATTHPGRLASAMNLVGAMKADKPEIPDAEPTIATHETVAIASTGFFRDRPQDLFDLCSLGGKTVEIYWHLGRPGGSDVPCAVMVPGAEYAELVAMRDRIRSIAGKFGPG